MVATAMPNSNITTLAVQAETLTPVDRHEAAQIAAAELNQLLALLDQLSGDDWTQPTDCTEWNVHDMTAHLAGACAAYARWKDFFNQIVFNPYIMKAPVKVDAINRVQLENRAGVAPGDLISEFRQVAPRAIQIRKNLPGFMRSIRADLGPPCGKAPVAYLMDTIYPRDQWMHRMDICRATGKDFVVTPGHDGRLLDLVMVDIAQVLAGSVRIQVNVTGALSATYRFGDGEPEAEIDIDFRTLNRRSSARLSVADTLPEVTVRGDQSLAQTFLERCEVLY